MNLAGRLSARLQEVWWRPTPSWWSRGLLPLAWLLQQLARLHRSWTMARVPRSAVLPVPVIVVGNLVVGGAGKTPTTMALASWLRAQGWRPGIVSRGYGRSGTALHLVSAESRAADCGDEPLLMHLRTHAPVAVHRNRLLAAKALLATHPELNILLADDGLQHWRLPRDLQVLVFDGRGAGNGLTLPAGPLRQSLPVRVPPHSLVLYNADRRSTALPGSLALRRLAGAVALADWWQGQPASMATLQSLARQSDQAPVLAAAGMAEPARFFGMLADAGIRVAPLPLADHAAFIPLPWPADTPDVLVTEKDAVKLRADQVGSTRVWVVALDFQLPDDFTQALSQALPPIAPTPP